MQEVTPLISSSVAGPLGVMHLPRLWMKILLHAVGRLPEGYRYGEGGFDQALCERFGLDRAKFVAYIVREKPTYQELERWVAAHATDLSPETVAAFNAQVTTANMRPEMAAERRAQLGLTDESFANAIALNNLDDWAAFHRSLTGEKT